MEQAIKLSIIIPVYNVERYIAECLNSILPNIPKDNSVEVILVNDGTPDNSVSIIKDATVNYNDIVRIIDQENQGLSMARNNGLTNARGDYIWFVDSDDYLLPDAICEIFNTIDNHPDVDVFSTFLRHYYEDTGKYKDNVKNGNHVYTGKEYLNARLPIGASQRFVFRHHFLKSNKLHFMPKVLHEDAIFGFEMMYLAKKVYVLEKPLYVYRIRTTGSIMSSIKIKTAYDLICGHKYLVEFANQKVHKEDYRKYRETIFGMILTLLDFCKDIYGKDEYKNFIQKDENGLYIKREARKILTYNKLNLKALSIAINPILFIWALKWRRYIKQLL